MSSRLWSLCLVAIATLDALPGNATSAERHPRSVLEGVAALDQCVTYTETRIPLGELIQKVAADTGTELTAARDVADEPVAAVIRDLPARVLLEQLADLLDYRWSGRTTNDQRPTTNAGGERSSLVVGRSSVRYEIWQDLAAKQREEALRQATRLAAERRFRQEVARHTRLAALPEAQFQRLLQAEERHQQDLERLPAADQHSLRDLPEEKERARQLTALQRLRSPIDRMLASLLGRLTDGQWTTLLRGEDLTFATEPQPGDLRLPSAISRVFRANTPIFFRPGTVITIMNGDGLIVPPGSAAWQEAAQRSEQRMRENWAAATGYRVKIRGYAEALQTGGSLSLSARAYPVLSGDPPRFGAQGGSLFIDAGAAETETESETTSASARVGLERDPVLGAVRPFQPEVKPHALSFGPGNGLAWRLRELLPDLARTYGASFIADAYAGAPLIAPEQIAASEPIPLFALLDRLAGTTQCWDRRGGLIRLRSRSWFFDRSREIPMRLVRRWQALFEAYGALPLETYVEMASVLTQRQVEGVALAAMEAGLPNDLWGLNSSCRTLRVYASLSPAQRAALWQGQALPLAQMGPAQQALLLATVRAQGRYRPARVDLAPWSAGTFSLTMERRVRIREQPHPGAVNTPDDGTNPGYHEEAVPAPAAVSADAGSPRPAGAATGGTSLTGVPASSAPQAGEPALPVLPAPNASPDTGTRYPILRLAFRLQAAPNLRETILLTVAAP